LCYCNQCALFPRRNEKMRALYFCFTFVGARQPQMPINMCKRCSNSKCACNHPLFAAARIRYFWRKSYSKEYNLRRYSFALTAARISYGFNKNERTRTQPEKTQVLAAEREYLFSFPLRAL